MVPVTLLAGGQPEAQRPRLPMCGSVTESLPSGPNPHLSIEGAGALSCPLPCPGAPRLRELLAQATWRTCCSSWTCTSWR